MTLSKTRPRVGIAVTASVTDPDGSISGLTWQWSRNTSNTGNFTDIEGANSDTYTPVADDATPNNAMFLRATASYTDGQSAPDAATKKMAMGTADNMVAEDTRNRAPVFDDQDTETDGVQNTETTRKVEENAKAVDDDAVATDNVGRPVMATDPDPNVDILTYTLGGPDKDSFTVRDNGQIEVGADPNLDYETKTTYMVTVMAEDSFGASATIMVTITVTDMDEAPTIMVGGLAVTSNRGAAIDYAENGTGMVADYDAVGPDAAMATWSLDGDDAGDFRISTAGVLTFRASPNYESPADADGDNVYEVTVTANDGENTATKAVTVTVTDVGDDVVTGETLVDRYDANDSGDIGKTEVLKAINDYLFDEGDEPISRAEVLMLINLYLFP